MGVVIALISGALMSIQGVFNTEVTKGTSMWVTNSFVQFTALLACLVMWFSTERESFLGLMKITPKYLLLGGVIGAVITYTVVRSMGILGAAKAVLIIVVSQIAVAYLIELFGMFGVEKAQFQIRKLFGIIIAIGGIILFKWE